MVDLTDNRPRQDRQPWSGPRDLVIDMTPTCVNRTAIYHIALDTAAELESITADWQYCGRRGAKPADRAAEKSLQAAFFSDVGAWSRDSVHEDEFAAMPDASDGFRRLYFDPIYTLYRPLAAGDIVFVLDLSTITNPEWHNPAVSKVYERAFRKLVTSKARIVSISANCTAALRSNLSVPARDIVTVPLYLRDLSSAPTRQPEAGLVAHRFLLCVGSLETRKNLVGLINAFALSGLSERGWTLALAGGDGEGAELIRQAAAGIQGVSILGFVKDDELAWLYANAAAFVYPSFLEGFGLPLVEAMAHGLPCVASLTGASSEICEHLGVLVDPYDLNSVVLGMLRVVDRAAGMTEDDRAALVAKAETFSFGRYMDALAPALAS